MAGYFGVFVGVPEPMPATVEAAAAKAAGSWAKVAVADARVARDGAGIGVEPQPTKNIVLKTSILKAKFFMTGIILSRGWFRVELRKSKVKNVFHVDQQLLPIIFQRME